MAQIDERARVLNQPEPEPEPVDDVDEDQDDQDEDEDQGDVDEDEDGDDDADEGTAPAPRPGQDSGAALSAGVVLGFLAYSLVIQVVRGGTGQLKGWLKAKLINTPYLVAAGKGGTQA